MPEYFATFLKNPINKTTVATCFGGNFWAAFISNIWSYWARANKEMLIKIEQPITNIKSGIILSSLFLIFLSTVFSSWLLELCQTQPICQLSLKYCPVPYESCYSLTYCKYYFNLNGTASIAVKLKIHFTRVSTCILLQGEICQSLWRSLPHR